MNRRWGLDSNYYYTLRYQSKQASRVKPSSRTNQFATSSQLNRNMTKPATEPASTSDSEPIFDPMNPSEPSVPSDPASEQIDPIDEVHPFDETISTEVSTDFFSANFDALKEIINELTSQNLKRTHENIVDKFSTRNVNCELAEEILDIALERNLIKSYWYARKLNHSV